MAKLERTWILWICALASFSKIDCNRTFAIDYENNQFLMDGMPFRYVSGSMHYFRVPRVYWTDRFLKMKAAGLNAVQTYIEWSQHEPLPGTYNFEGSLDITAFTEMAAEAGLYVIFRAGPYICGARDMGGFPFWLLQQNPQMNLRSSDPTYLEQVSKWLNVLLPKIRPLIYQNGGPVISIQVENEYGSYPACDYTYTSWLRDTFRSLLGNEVVLFTTDGGADYFLACGKVQGLYATVDFGPGDDVEAAFHAQRNHEPSGPLVNSEYYPGWDDNWGYPRDKTPVDAIAGTLDNMLALNASVNMYMFTGGTSFGFNNGAVLSETFDPYTTTYDYSAPLTEAGDITDKFKAIRNVIGKYMPVPPDPLPANTTKQSYGSIPLEMVGSLFDLVTFITNASVSSTFPKSFEELGQAYGFVIYETVIDKLYMRPSYLNIPDIRDRAYVFLDMKYTGILSRTDGITSLPIQPLSNMTLSILVENQGRIDYGAGNNDFKGIFGNKSVSISNEYLEGWTMTQLPFNDTATLEATIKSLSPMSNLGNKPTSCWTGSCQPSYPAIFSGDFVINSSVSMDTFLHLPGWSKGVAFLNGVNLGRYWPTVGPQVTLFVPKSYLNPSPDWNTLILLELEESPCEYPEDCRVQFIDHAILSGPTPYRLQSSGSHKRSKNP